jgi:hypothetical protein
VLPNGTTGWVRRRALGGYASVHTRLDVDLRRLRATLYRDGRPILRAAVGVESERSPTPRGKFYVRNSIRLRNADVLKLAKHLSIATPLTIH